MTGTVVVHDAAAGKWLRFDSPVEVITAAAIHEVAPALRTIEELAGKKNLYAAGFLSYESAAAFDPAFSTHSPNFPLLWFGLYRVPEEIILPQPDFKAYSLGDAVPTISRLQYEQAIERIKDISSQGTPTRSTIPSGCEVRFPEIHGTCSWRWCVPSRQATLHGSIWGDMPSARHRRSCSFGWRGTGSSASP